MSMARVAMRDALLAGESDAPLLVWEAEVAEWETPAVTTEPDQAPVELTDQQKAYRRQVETLRHAFDYAVRLREASSLMNRTVALPGGKLARFTEECLEFDVTAAQPNAILAEPEVGLIPKALLDACLAAARGLNAAETPAHG